MIEVGEYVRTVDGKIGIFVRYSSRKEDSFYKSPANCFIRLNNRKSDLQCFRDYIIKHSKNIIDLIEVGDYVNGYICRYITDIDTGEEYLCNYDLNEMRWIPLENIDIWESVVTKEQFARMEYKIEKGE